VIDQFLDRGSLFWVLLEALDDQGHEVMNALVSSLNQVRVCLASEELVLVSKSESVQWVISHNLGEGLLQSQKVVKGYSQAENVLVPRLHVEF